MNLWHNGMMSNQLFGVARAIQIVSILFEEIKMKLNREERVFLAKLLRHRARAIETFMEDVGETYETYLEDLVEVAYLRELADKIEGNMAK